MNLPMEVVSGHKYVEVRPVGVIRMNAVRRILSQPSALSVTNWYAARNNCAIVMNSKHITGCRSVSYVYTNSDIRIFSKRLDASL